MFNKTSMPFKESLDLTGLPIVTFMSNGKNLHFLLDTGSNMSFINSSLIDELNAERINSESSTLGAEGVELQTLHYRIPIEYKNNRYNEIFGALDLNTTFNSIEEDTGIKLHGILGSKFFKKYRYIIDFNELIAYRK